MTLSGTVALPESCFKHLPDKVMVRMIIELVPNQSFTLTTCDNKQSKLRCLKNRIFQRSVLTSLLFNFHMYDLPSTISRKFTFANNLSLLLSSRNWKVFESTSPLEVRSQDIIFVFLWKLESLKRNFPP